MQELAQNVFSSRVGAQLDISRFAAKLNFSAEQVRGGLSFSHSPLSLKWPHVMSG